MIQKEEYERVLQKIELAKEIIKGQGRIIELLQEKIALLSEKIDILESLVDK